jgi:hypothetical protein
LLFVSFPRISVDGIPLLVAESKKMLAQTRVGYVLKAEVAARLKDPNEREVAAEKAAKHV